MNWIEVFNVLPALAGMITTFVKEVEMPGIPGAQKKNAVLEILKAACDGLVLCGVKVPTTIILTVAGFVIDAVVAAYNLIGVFKKDAAEAAG